MNIILFISIITLAFAPILLVFHKKMKNSFLFIAMLAVFNAQPLSTIILPFFFNPELGTGALQPYFILIAIHYFLLFFLYLIFFELIPSSENNKLDLYFRSNRKIVSILILLALFFFSILVIKSNGIFLLDPRKGYQYHRQGAGFIWALYITSVSAIFLYTAVFKRITLGKILFASVLMYLTGSKKLILDVFLKSFLVLIWKKRKINVGYIAASGVFGSLIFLKLFDQFSAKKSFLTRLETYFDFMKQAEKVFTDYGYGTLKFLYGEIFATSFWRYVPRALYPAKPFAYGPVKLVEMYYPGMAETGHTPSFGPLTSDFVDFSWFAPLTSIVLDPLMLIQIASISIVAINGNVSRKIKFLALLIVFCPGFGFHIPILFSFIIAAFLLPSLSKPKSIN